MASNVRAFPSQQMTVMPPHPSQQDWVWDGAQWCPPGCGPMPPPCPPPGFPTPCPPWFPPPAGQAPWYPGANGGVSFSASPPANPIRGNLWWDGAVLHLFDGAAWVDIGPPVAGSGALKGVTDGSVAAPGYVGEVISQNTSGTVTVIPPPGAAATSFTALVVPPGDWSIQGTLALSNMTSGVYFDDIIFNLFNGSVSLATYAIEGFFTAAGFEGGDFSCALVPLSVSVSTSITCSVQVIAIAGGNPGTANYSFFTKGRRMR